MSCAEHTPTTERVRELYSWKPIKTVEGVFDSKYMAEFDRWLAEHDAEVAKAERERIMDLIGDGAAYLIAKGDLGSATLVALGKLEDMIGGKNE